MNLFQVNASSKNTIPGLHGLRVICILVIIFFHLQFTGFIHTKDNFIIHTFLKGHTFLNIFFEISGFLITRLLLIEEDRNGSISLRNFYVRRVIRIFPAYYFLLFVYFILQLSGFLHLTGISWLTAITFTKQFHLSPDWETAHLWTLSIEEVFYLSWPLLFIAFRKFRTKIALGFIFFVTAFRIIMPLFASGEMHAKVYDNLTIFNRGDALMLGCLLALHYNKITSWLIRGNLVVKLILLLTAIFVLVAAPKASYYLQGPGISNVANTLFGSIGLLTNILIACLIAVLINLKGFWYNFLNNNLMNYLSRVSYSIYLWQQIFISFRPEFHQFSVAVLLLIIFAIANLSYFLIEKPFSKFKYKYE